MTRSGLEIRTSRPAASMVVVSFFATPRLMLAAKEVAPPAAAAL
jgi:hypothetical protein